MLLKFLHICCLVMTYCNFCSGQQVPIKNFQKRVQYDSQGMLQYFPKAINADVVKKVEFQNFISIQTKTGNHLCGAMMLDVDFVITTASCVTKLWNNVPYINSELQVMNDALQNKTVKVVKHIFRHPEFNSTTLDNDIAILNIQPFNWTKDIEMLTAIDEPSSSSDCKVIGWGKSENNEPFLHKFDAVITNDSNCQSLYSHNALNKICVQGHNNSCLEEPGSGLICDDELLGILSFGNTCTERGDKQMVYTDLTKYNIWIDEVFRTVITKTNVDDEPSLVTNKIEEVEVQQITSTTIASTRTTERFKPFSSTITPISQQPHQEPENDGHWAYQVVLDTCQLSFVTCEPVWSAFNVNIECKRGYFPYGCFHIVKRFVKDEASTNVGRNVENEKPNQFLKFKTYLKNKPLNHVQKTAENIFGTQKVSRSNLESNHENPVILTPYYQWFSRIFCLPVVQFSHFNNFPQHRQWRADCDRFQPHYQPPINQPNTRSAFQKQSANDDSKIYFPDDDILNGNQQ